MKNFIYLLFLFPIFSFAQEMEDIDKLTVDICNSLKSSAESQDSLKIQNAFAENLPGFIHKFHLTESSQDVWKKVFMRLQRNCDLYQKFANKDSEKTSDWRILDKKPERVTTQKQFENFWKNHKKFYYLEADGKKTNVVVENGFWSENFADGSTSKLKFVPDSKTCKFYLEFIESNNETRKNFSVKGDRYYYEIISIDDKKAEIIVSGEDSKTYYKFNLYPII